MSIIRKNANKVDEKILVMIRVKNEVTKKKETWSLRMEEDDQDVDKARALALLWIVRKVKAGDLKLRTDDKRIMDWIDGRLNKVEEENWLNIENKEIWKEVLRRLRKRGSKTMVIKVKKESKTKNKIDELRNENGDVKLIKGLKIKRQKDSKFLKKGAALDAMTQKKAYEMVNNERGEKPGGLMTLSNLDKIKTVMAGICRRIKEKEIWKGLEKMYSPQVAVFTWRMIHGRVKCGSFFRHIPNWQEKEFCSCGASESIEHILVLCEKSGQQELWKLVGEKWKQETGLEMGGMNIGA